MDDRIGSRRTILLSLGMLNVLAVLLLFVHSSAVFWILALGLGFVVGPVQAASRSHLSRIVPEHRRGGAFGLFAFAGKATSFLGPLLVASLVALSGSQRVGMGAVLPFLAGGLCLMASVRDPR